MTDPSETGVMVPMCIDGSVVLGAEERERAQTSGVFFDRLQHALLVWIHGRSRRCSHCRRVPGKVVVVAMLP